MPKARVVLSGPRSNHLSHAIIMAVALLDLSPYLDRVLALKDIVCMLTWAESRPLLA